LLRLRPLIALALLAATPVAGDEPASDLVDRVVAVVDEEPILLSDLERAQALGTVTRREGESDAALRRRTLDELVAWRLRLHEVARFGIEEAPLTEVDRQIERIRIRYPEAGAWQAELDRLGLDEAQVRQILARQLAVLDFVEQRLGPRVFVGVDEIQSYYDGTLVPELRERGDPVPPVEEVREAIRVVLREAKLNEEVESWTRRLRLEADVVDLLDQEERPLPPPVAVFETPPGDS